METDTQSNYMPAWRYRKRGYALDRSLKKLRQSLFGSVLTILVLGVALTIPVLAVFLANDFKALPFTSGETRSLTLFLDPAITDLEGADFARDLEQQPVIATTRYLSRDEALELVASHSNVDQALQLLDFNPLPGSVVLYPERSLSADEVRGLATQLRGLDGVDQVQVDLEWVEKLGAVATVTRISLTVLAVILTLITLTVIANTIRLEITRQRREVAVTQLLGAPRSFVVRPFLYLGAFYGLLGGLVAIGIAFITFFQLQPAVVKLAQSYGSQFTLSWPTFPVAAAVLASITLLGIVSAWLTLVRDRSITECNI